MDRAGQRVEGPTGHVGPVRPVTEQESPGIAGLTVLCGRSDGPPLAPPRRLVVGAHRLAADIERRSARCGRRVSIDAMGTLAERAAVNGLGRRGDVSCGGSAHLIGAADGWVAVNLARPDDWELVDAWLLPSSPLGVGCWAAVAEEVSGRTSGDLVARATLVGLPVASVGERARVTAGWRRPDDDGTPGVSGVSGVSGVNGVTARRIGTGAPPAALDDLLVVDLSALWAGPLAGSLLHRAGARVVKVESWSRPDGARQGSPAFFATLNRGKASVALDFATPDGRRLLGALVAQADLVITAARPRALAQLGLGPEDRREGAPRVWVSITGYGVAGASADRVAFGDDAAVAGGLVVWDDRGPCFCGDAVADPLSGMAAAAAALSALEEGGSWVIDVSMADVAAGCSGTETAAADRSPPRAPGPAHPTRRDPPDGADLADMGADTESVLSDLGIR